MANNMVFKAQRCKAHAVAIPGIVRVSLSPSFGVVSKPVISDLLGGANADRSGHVLNVQVDFEDCTLATNKDKLVTLLQTTPTSAGLLFHTAESGLATFTKHEIGANANTPMRFHSGSFSGRFDQPGKFTIAGSVSHNTAAVSWAESWKKTRNRSQAQMDSDAAFVAADRIGPITNVTVGGSISPDSLLGLSYNIQPVLARSVLGDFLGEVVDVIGYMVTGSLSFKDNKDAATSFVYDLMTSAAGDIVGTFREHGGTDTRTLTLKNANFEPSVTETYDAVGGHSQFDVPFSLGWDGTIDTLAELIAWAD